MSWTMRGGTVVFVMLAGQMAAGCGISKPLEPPPQGAAGTTGSGGRGGGHVSGGGGGSAGTPASSSMGGGAGTSTGAGGAASSGTNGWTMASGPTFACGPAGAGLVCSCGNQPFFPAPPGSPAGFVPFPTLSDGPGYRTIEELDALVVGRWVRIAGEGELSCEQYGLDFTSDHHIIPLVIASDGSVQRVPTSLESFTLDFSRGATPALIVGDLTTNAPLFTAGPDSFYFVYSPWVALYNRVR